MYRLLQGDVGSGKTALALICSLAVIADGAQCLLLAPTALLARQHFDFASACLSASQVRLGLLTGGMDTEEKRTLLQAVREHRIDLLFGTHALLEDEVRFADLGFAVIDEQHRFGVEQRAVLVNRTVQSYRPDLLLMTATPIPRTLALTAFGDLAVSRIAGKPPRRGTVTTEVRRLHTVGELAGAIQLEPGEQAYVICPLREESEKVSAADAESIHAALKQRFSDQVALLHGAMSEGEKLAALAAFAAGRTRILVSTTVIEVGIDVPAATLMVVLDADRFGLATLHQLRGRVGRGSKASRCLFFYRGEDAGARLRILAESEDGLAIAEADLRERGPGQLLGTGQHGAFKLKAANLVSDLDLLQSAHQLVRERLSRNEACPPGLKRLQELLGDPLLLAGG